MFGSLTILFSHFKIIRQLIAPKKLLLWTTKFVLNLASEATNFSSFMKASVGALHGRVKKRRDLVVMLVRYLTYS